MEGGPTTYDLDVEKAMESEFRIVDRYIDYETHTFVVAPKEGFEGSNSVKEPFSRVVQVLRPKGYLPFLRRENGRLVIRVIHKRPASRPRYTINLVLFLATVGTIFYDGYLRSNIPIFTRELMPNVPVVANATVFLAAIVAVFGLHELAHKVVSMRRGAEASMPYFIPAPPGLGGTFGAVITVKEPPTNRDALFDLGLSGPLAGFLVTVVIAILGIASSFIVPFKILQQWVVKYPEIGFQSLPLPPLLDLAMGVLKPIPSDSALVLHPLAFAAWVGCILSFINLIPSWQLDGGHVIEALVGKRRHRIFSIVGVGLLFLLGFYMMALLMAFFMFRTREDPGPLDDVSPLSPSRKMLTVVYTGMLLLTFVSLNPFTA